LINAQLGVANTFSIHCADGRNTYTGGSAQVGIGLGGFSRTLTTNVEYIDFSLPVCTAFDIIYYESNGSTVDGNVTPNTGSGEYSVDGGGTVNIVDAGSVHQYKVVPVTGLAATSHTLRVRGGAGGGFYPCQINCHSGAGVVVGRSGRAGYTLSDFLGRTTTNNQSAAARARLLLAFQQGLPNLVILLTGHNECNLQLGTANGPQTVTGAAAVVSEVASLLAPLNIPLLLVSEPDPNNSDLTFPFKFRDYWSGWRALAVPGSNIAHLAIGDYWGNFSDALASGFVSDASGVHPLRKGYGSMATLLCDVLSSAPMYRGKLLTGA
jgi:lysophospholipase L1-like esterase